MLIKNVSDVPISYVTTYDSTNTTIQWFRPLEESTNFCYVDL